MLDIFATLSGALKDLRSEPPERLAYLALTSKVEHPFRDRLAWRLHEILWPNYLVAREWRRVDLAILDRKTGGPAALVELKAMYTADAVAPDVLRRFAGMMSDDAKKAAKLADAPVFNILIATHVDGEITGALSKAVKYANGLNRHQADDLLSRARSEVAEALPAPLRVDAGDLPQGSAFGLNVSLHYWLMEADRAAAAVKQLAV